MTSKLLPTWFGLRTGALVLLVAGVAGAAPAAAQSLDTSVANALNANCAALGAARNASLTALCAAAAGAPGSDAGGTTSADLNPAGEDQESKIKRRLQKLRTADKGASGMSAGDSDQSFSMGNLAGFVSLDYQNVDKKTTSLTDGFDSNKGGGTLGLDYSFGKAVLGAAVSYGYTHGMFSGVGGSFNTNTFGGYVYGSVLPFENAYVDAVVGYNYLGTSLRRNATFAVNGNVIAAGTEKSDPNANEFRAGISGGYDFSYQNLTFGPRAGLNFSYNRTDAFSESGTTGLELAYNGQTIKSFTSSVGVHGSAAISTGFGVLVPQASADYIHEFSNDQQTFRAHFVGDLNAAPTQLNFQNDSPDRDYFGLGAGVVLVLPHGISPYLNYRALVGDSIKTTQTVTAGMRIEF